VAKRKLLSVFLDIPERTAKYMNNKCINFLASFVDGDEEELHSEEALQNIKAEQDDERASLFGVRRKKFKNVDTGLVSQLSKVVAVFILVETYFFLNHFLGLAQTNKISTLFTEFNYTTMAEAYYSMYLNAEYTLVISNAWGIFGNSYWVEIPIIAANMATID
jgi:hypothetical protein